MNKHLIIFTRYPEPGKTKTRLIPVVGEIGAANLHRQMTEKTLNTARQLQKIESLSIEVRFTGGNLDVMQNWLGADLIYDAQSFGDLGNRMGKAFQMAFYEEKNQILMVGTDCPELTVDILFQGFKLLQDHDIVIGPAKDGGYYLIGLKRYIPELFKDIPWGTSMVCEITLKICETLNLSVGKLPVLLDIDRPEDLVFTEFSNEQLGYYGL
ncbi:MAG TPA: TIGR04282 family arsenosugar biosynthesis glycosyltransferase [Candidatus Obscuribacterales bacterium]